MSPSRSQSPPRRWPRTARPSTTSGSGITGRFGPPISRSRRFASTTTSTTWTWIATCWMASTARSFNRLLFALRFQDPNFILNSAFTSESRLLYRRNVDERIRQMAPFLRLDQDPYIVVADGALYWIQDAYTISDRYPYAQPYQPSST